MMVDFIIVWSIITPLIVGYGWYSYRLGYRKGIDHTLNKWRSVDYRDVCPHGTDWGNCPDCRY